jgi:transposase
MPWRVLPMSEIRLAFVHSVRSLHHSVRHACRLFGISPKTGYKWLQRHQKTPDQPLEDRSRRPHHSPLQTSDDLEQEILRVHRQFGWGAPKIAVHLQHLPTLPSERTITNILRRHGCTKPETPEPSAPGSFERSEPNELWQIDHKGPLEIARQKIKPLSILDDHSRYLLALTPCVDGLMSTAWNVLWNVMGDVGMPQAILADNSFSQCMLLPVGFSWFDSMLIRLGIEPHHGRPYHPQTQGKVERFHGTLERELWPRARRESLPLFTQDCESWRINVYNSLRPHEALGMQVPLSRWRPSSRPRPDQVPLPQYPPGSVLRSIGTNGRIQWHGQAILVGRAMAGQKVRIEDHGYELRMYYCWKLVRSIAASQLRGYGVL